MRATWNGATIAESPETVVVEGNHYFPPGSLRRDLIVPSQKHTHCPWKGDADYFSIEVGGERNQDAAWTYPQPKEAAKDIRDHVAFWNGVVVEE
jgi:uncharacterized protein (DUF427 family)